MTFIAHINDIRINNSILLPRSSIDSGDSIIWSLSNSCTAIPMMNASFLTMSENIQTVGKENSQTQIILQILFFYNTAAASSLLEYDHMV
jgi:hypothetical protein